MLLCYQNVQSGYYVVPTGIVMIDTNLPAISGIQPGDTIALAEGHRDLLTLRNIRGSSTQPVVVINHDGVVRVSSNHYFGISIRNCQFLHLTGTGTSESYGIKIENIGGAGIGAGEGTSDLEIDHIEVNDVSSSGMLIKTNATCTDYHRGDFTQYNIKIHDNLITHTGNEGLYIGSTLFTGKLINCNGTDSIIFDPMMENVWVYNNIIDHTGWDGLQVSSATNAYVFNNFITNNSMSDKPNQSSGIILGGGFQGQAYNNVIKEGLGNGFAVFSNGQTYIYNNQILRSNGNYGLYLNDKVADSSGSNFYFVNNLIVSPEISGVLMQIDHMPSNSIVISNNCIYDPGYLQEYEQQNQTLKAYINSNGTNIIAEANYLRPQIDPNHYINAQLDNYDLTSSAPMIDQGKKYQAMGFMLEDCDGDLRYQGNFIDIGPHESSFSSSINDQIISETFGVSMPQPIRNKTIEATIYSKHNIIVDLHLTSLNGKTNTLYEGLRINSGTTYKTFDFSELTPGMYILHASGQEETLLSQKVVILN